MRNNPIVTQSLKLWSIIRKNYGWQSGSLLGPVHPSHLFSPSIRDDSYGIWRQGGVDNMKALFVDYIFPSFGQLRHKFNLPQSHFSDSSRFVVILKLILPVFPICLMCCPWKPYLPLSPPDGVQYPVFIISYPTCKILLWRLLDLHGREIWGWLWQQSSGERP